MIGKLDDYMRFNEAALSLRSQRQELIASNIANADTPNFKARDIDFATALAGALGRTSASTASTSAAVLKNTAPAHLAGAAPGSLPNMLPDGTALLYRVPSQGAVDGNTVDMDVERNQFADNAIRYEAGITLINAQIRGMMAAIQG